MAPFINWFTEVKFENLITFDASTVTIVLIICTTWLSLKSAKEAVKDRKNAQVVEIRKQIYLDFWQFEDVFSRIVGDFGGGVMVYYYKAKRDFDVQYLKSRLVSSQKTNVVLIELREFLLVIDKLSFEDRVKYNDLTETPEIREALNIEHIFDFKLLAEEYDILKNDLFLCMGEDLNIFKKET